MDLTDIKKLLDEQASAFEDFKTKHNQVLTDIQVRQGRELLGGASDIAHPAYELVSHNGKRYPALRKGQRVSDYTSAAEGEDKSFNLGEYVRDIVLGRKLVSGSALVPTYVGSMIIDDVRAQLALVQAGAVTIPIDGPTNFARITADPTVYEHAEGTNDISESNPMLTAVSLDPGTLAALIPLSLEVVQDSPNLDNVLHTALAGAFAKKLDTVGIATVLADSAIPTSSVAHDPATFVGTLLALGEAMAADQPVPDACIVEPANFVARHSILETGGGGWLGKPPVLEPMREIPTTSMTTNVSVLGGFTRGVGIAMRFGLTVEVVRYGKPTFGMHYLVAMMRAAAVVLQPKALFIQKKVVE